MTRPSVLYDPIRGGFIFSFDDIRHERREFCQRCGLLYFLTDGGRLGGFECEGRMPLRRIHASESVAPYPSEIWGDRIKEISPKSLTHMREANEKAYEEFIANWPQGTYEVGDTLRVKLLYLTQTPEKICLWFTRTNEVARSNWTREESSHCGVVIWYSTRAVPLLDFERERGWPARRLVAGIEVPFSAAAAAYPIRQLHVIYGDVK